MKCALSEIFWGSVRFRFRLPLPARIEALSRCCRFGVLLYEGFG